ncbi:hypothetical protein GCM10010531_19420 [Blastococcus jejuensis]|uniref:Aerotolerance regulator N-terminal domain-containing protein n=1 Tax=Blastococcus jejuensis TaxID=351224 RepID=A0ABP6P585_9ACTN
MPYAEAFLPNPWLMGVVLIAIAPVLWWLAPDIARDLRDGAQMLWPRRIWRRRPPPRFLRALHGLYVGLARFTAMLTCVGGVAMLVVAAT